MLSHPVRVRSACHASRSIGNELRRNFFRSFSIETIFAFGKLRCGRGRNYRLLPVPANFASGSTVLRVFILGGTGAIGAPIVRELVDRGHDVFALARSDFSAAKLSQFDATAIGGDISVPTHWAANLPRLDAIIHTPCDFNTDMRR
jgi:hypothetical protein